jgi:predicted CopG family antitoxin
MSINDWKMQEEIQNDFKNEKSSQSDRRIIFDNWSDEEVNKKIRKDAKDEKLIEWIKSYYPNLSKQDIQDIITESKSLLLQKISKDINQ